MVDGSVLTPEGEVEASQDEIEEMLESQRTSSVDKIPVLNNFTGDGYVQISEIEGGSTVAGDIKVDGGEEVGKGLEDITASGGELKVIGYNSHVLQGLKNSDLKFDKIDAREHPIFWNAENTSIEFGSLKSNSLLDKSKESRVKGEKADVYSFATGAERGKLSFGHLSADKGLKGAENTFVTADTLRTSDTSMIGTDASGSVLAARSILGSRENIRETVTNSKPVSSLKSQRLEGKFSEDLTVITQDENVENSITYRGDWDRLEGYLKDRVSSGGFEPLDVFDIREEFDQFSELEIEMEEVRGLYEDVKTEFGKYSELEEEFELEDLEGSNEDIYNRLKQFDAVDRELVKAVNDPEEDSNIVSLENVEETLKLQGDWEGLKSYAQELSEEDLEALELFDIEESLESTEDLRGEIDHLQYLFSRVDENYRQFQDTTNLKLSSKDSNKEKLEFLEDTEFYNSLVDAGAVSRVSVDVASGPEEALISIDKGGLGSYTTETSIEGGAEGIEEWLGELDAGKFEALKLFDLPGEFDNLEQLDEKLEELEKDYREVESAAEAYRSLTERLDLEELEGSNEDIYDKLVNLEDEVAPEVSEELGIDESNAVKILQSDKTGYLMDKLGRRSRKDLGESFEDVREEFSEEGIERGVSEAGMSLVGQVKRAYRKAKGKDIGKDEFIELFSGERPEQFLVEPDFEKSIYIDPDGEVSTDPEEVKNESYRQGLELLDELSRNERKFSTSEYDFAEHVLEEKAELREDLEDIREGLETGEFEYEDVQEQMQEINEEIDSKEDEYHEQYIQEWFQHLSADLDPLMDVEESDRSDIDPGDLEHALRQAKQHLFKKRSSAYNQAKDIVSGLETAGADISEGEVSVSVYDKTIDSEMPDKESSRCCAFPGGVADDLLMDYMSDPSTQILEIEKGQEKGYAIGYEVNTLSEERFFVETIETAGNMFRDETVVEAVAESIEEYAETAEYDGIVFNQNASNSAPQEFSRNLDEMEDYDSETFLGRKTGQTNYNESLPPITTLSPVEIPVYQGHKPEKKA